MYPHMAGLKATSQTTNPNNAAQLRQQHKLGLATINLANAKSNPSGLSGGSPCLILHVSEGGYHSSDKGYVDTASSRGSERIWCVDEFNLTTPSSCPQLSPYQYYQYYQYYWTNTRNPPELRTLRTEGGSATSLAVFRTEGGTVPPIKEMGHITINVYNWNSTCATCALPTWYLTWNNSRTNEITNKIANIDEQ